MIVPDFLSMADDEFFVCEKEPQTEKILLRVISEPYLMYSNFVFKEI